MEIAFTLETAPLDAALIGQVGALGARVFARSEPNYVDWRLANMPDVSVFCARAGERLVGFKAGYARSQRTYYSWLGGVDPEFRRRGLASELMERQHAWLAERGYATVETATNQENQAMAQVNLKHGFSVSGMRMEPGRVQILFSKTLAGRVA